MGMKRIELDCMGFGCILKKFVNTNTLAVHLNSKLRCDSNRKKMIGNSWFQSFVKVQYVLYTMVAK